MSCTHHKLVRTWYEYSFFFSCFFFIPFIIFALLFSLVVLTQIRGHVAGSSLPLPTTVRALHFLSREDFSSSLVDCYLNIIGLR